MTSLLTSCYFFELCVILIFWSIGLIFLLSSPDFIIYTIIVVPYIGSFVLTRKLLNHLQIALHFSSNFTSQNIVLYTLTDYFCTIFIIGFGIVLVTQMIGLIFF
jgi:hypothetical protein